MKPAAVTAIVVLALALLAWIRAGQDFDIRSILPLIGGHEINVYDLGGLLMLLIACLGLARLARTPREEEAERELDDFGSPRDDEDHDDESEDEDDH